MIENLKSVLEEISSKNNLGENIVLVGATKTVDIDTINLAIKNGLKVVAENKVQEFREKHDKIIGANEQFIGHLQTNKVKYIIGKVSLIQSVDRLELLNEINRQAEKLNIKQNVLIEVNVSKEESKSGFYVEELEKLFNSLNNYHNVNVLGLMTMFPKNESEENVKNMCLQMRSIYDKLIEKGYNLQYLSMGMSEDYKVAIKNGSNMIRLGSKIFGQRNYGEK